MVPDGSAAIVLELENRGPADWYLRGPIVRPDERRFGSAATLVGVRLRPGVAFILSGVPAHTTVGRRLSLSAVKRFSGLTAERPPARTAMGYIEILQRFLVERLRGATVHPAVSAALFEIEQIQGGGRIADVAARSGVSPRHLNRLMRVWVGYGAKRFARVTRLQATLEHIGRTPTRPAAALASANGYFDQAHLTFDLTRFTGATPHRLASSRVADFSKTRCE
jgi:AraC-like DNA-binding protein